MKISELAEQFLAYHVEASLRDSTQDTTRNILRNHIIPILGDKPIDTLARIDIMAWKASQLKSVGKKTVKNRLAVLNRMLEFAKEMEYIAAFPRLSQDAPRLKDPEWLERKDLARLLAATAPVWRTMMLVVVNTGMRIGEARGLEWGHVDLPKKMLRLQQATSGNGNKLGPLKNGKPRSIPLNNAALRELRSIRRVGPFVFGQNPKGLILSYHACRVAMKQAVNEAGFARRVIGWHSLRHTFASEMAMRGCPLRTLQELLGHSSLDMVMRYAHVAPSTTHTAVALLDDPSEE